VRFQFKGIALPGIITAILLVTYPASTQTYLSLLNGLLLYFGICITHNLLNKTILIKSIYLEVFALLVSAAYCVMSLIKSLPGIQTKKLIQILVLMFITRLYLASRQNYKERVMSRYSRK